MITKAELIEAVDALMEKCEELMQERDDLRRRLAAMKEGYEGACPTCEPVAKRNDKLREVLDAAIAERDEARRQVCLMNPYIAHIGVLSARDIAKARGWDCFGEEGGP